LNDGHKGFNNYTNGELEKEYLERHLGDPEEQEDTNE